MKPKLKPGLDLDSIQQTVIDEVVRKYDNGALSLRALAKETGFSMTKVRKILITAGVYSTETSTAVEEAHKNGLTVEEIAIQLNMTASNVYTYLPYQTVLYNLDEKSVNAERQARYRRNKDDEDIQSIQGSIEDEREARLSSLQSITEKNKVRRKGIMYVGINEKLRKALPKGFCLEERDPSEGMRLYGPDLDPFNPPDPSFDIWHADLAVKGQRKNKKVAMVVENARCGFAVVVEIKDFNDETDVDEYRLYMEEAVYDAIRKGFINCFFPPDNVYDSLGDSIRFVKAGRSASCHRVTELCERIERNVESDPMDISLIALNSSSRKFGNSPLYRHIDDATAECLHMTGEDFQSFMARKYSRESFGVV